MGNLVETVFKSTDTGVVDTIDKINNKLPEIVRNSQSASNGIDLLELKLRRLSAIAANHNVEISKADYVNLRTKGVAAIDATIDRIQKATNAQRILTTETLRTADAYNKVDAAVARIREQQTRTQTISNESSLAVRTPGFAAPNVAAGNAIENATRKIDLATEAQKRFHGATLVGSQVLRQFGVEGTRAIEVLINQFATMGVTLKDLFKSPTIGYTLLLAGVVAAGEAVNHVFSQIRENAEASLKKAQDFAKVTPLGLRGAGEQTEDELQDLYKIREDLNKLTKAGLYSDAQQLLGDKIGKGFTTEQLDIRIEQAKRRAEALGLDTRSQTELDAIKKITDAEKERVKVGQDLFKAKIEQFNAEDKLAKIQKEATSYVAGLRAQLADNPYQKFYIEAESQQKQFLERFLDASPQIKEAGKELIEQLRQRNIFAENLKRSGAVSDTIAERDKLRAGLGGQTIRDNETRNKAERDAILKELESGRGSLSGAQQDALLLKLSQKTGSQSALDRINSESIDRQIAIANSALASATTAEQRKLAIDTGLSATRDIGSLTPSQVEARARLLDQSLAIQQDVIREQRAREDRLQVSQDRFTAALNAFAETFGSSVGILSAATDQIKNGINLNVVTDSPSETKVDLGQGFIGNFINAATNPK